MIKSNNPHLAGGEQIFCVTSRFHHLRDIDASKYTSIIYIYMYIYIYMFIYLSIFTIDQIYKY